MKKGQPHQEASQQSHSNNTTKTSFTAQRQRLLEALRHGPVTTIQARDELNVMHPAGRVNELRDQGHTIITEMQWLVDAAGRKHKAGKYFLIRGAK